MRRLTHFRPAASMVEVVPREGIKRERGDHSAAAPATVSGEPATGMPLDVARHLGRRSTAATRKPGDLPPAAVTRERIGRGAPM